MIVVNSFLIAIANILHIIITAYIWIIIAAALMSWINNNPYNKIVQILHQLTEPAYSLIRKTKIPTIFNGIDIAPIFVLLILQFIDIFVVRLLNEIARSV